MRPARGYGDIGLSQWQGRSYLRYHFFPREHAPVANDPGYWDRFYAMEVKPEHIADIDGLVVLRPWVKSTTFVRGAGDLTVIGRSGAGFDKIDVRACTENDVALFNARRWR